MDRRSQIPFSSAPVRKLRAVQFGVLSPDEIRRMSVAEIKHEKSYENGMPKEEGMADRRLGSNGPAFPCLSCNCDDDGCPGHFGHIELAKPMYNIGFISVTVKILRCVCYYCSKLLCSAANVEKLLRISKSSARLRTAMHDTGSGKKTCSAEGGCGHTQPSISRDGFRVRITFDDSTENPSDRKQSLSAEKTLAIFKRISDRDCEAMGLSVKWSRPDWFILTLLPVPPPQVRPSVMQGGMRNEDDLTNKLGDIVKHNNTLRSLEATGAVAHAIKEQLDLVQYHVATYMNNEIPSVVPSTVRGGSRAIKSIGQRFKGKEGRVRGNLMGKRVNFSARTVITPDPNLKLHEVGVPGSIAKNLTFPEIVTLFNMSEMKRLVQNGPDEYPGAVYIERDDGQKVNLQYVRNRSELQLEVGYKVIRHIRDGDYVLFNRQPSLHKMSIMGHRIRVLPYSTFRLNLSVTSPYNADFDGDEMNLHVPQSHQTRAEVQELMLVPHCIVSPQSNKPVMGIIQDTLLGTSLFTRRDTFIERDLVMNLLMHVVDWDGIVPQPVIYKPKALWTGKQIFSLILPKVNLKRKCASHIDERDKGPMPVMDTVVEISNGELLMGIVCKKTVGSSANGLIHTTWKEFGPKRTDQLISQAQVLINHYVLQRGCSIGIGDSIADSATMNRVVSIISNSKTQVKDLIRKAQEKSLGLLPGKDLMESFETEVNKILNGARDSSGQKAEVSLPTSNNIKRMVSAGSKGSFINISQICACVGQQNVEGRRISYGFHRRTLPHFVMDDLGPESRGFVENSYLRGLTPSEFFFHAMGGREGLIDTAVKTAETGYIQRRLIKAMEDIMVRYDGTVRNSVDHIIQFLYGEDGMDATFLEEQLFASLTMSNSKLRDRYFLDPEDPRFGRDSKGHPYLDSDTCERARNDVHLHMLLKGEFDQIMADRDQLRDFILVSKDPKKPLAVNIDRLIWNTKRRFEIQSDSVSDLNPRQVMNAQRLLFERTLVLSLGEENAEEAIVNQYSAETGDDADENGFMLADQKPKLKDPLAREAQENATLMFQMHMRTSLSCKELIVRHRLTLKAFRYLLAEIESHFLSARVAPGENIGAIAAQSIGEPATQMTLNTFHYAGVSAKNVTLGVPRLKELINISKNTKTPSLEIFLLPGYSDDKDKAKEVQASLQHTTLQDVTQCTEIYYDPDIQSTVVDEDREMVESYFDLEEAPSGLSPWLLRVNLDKNILQDRGISMDLVENTIHTNFGTDIHVIRSQDNDERLVVRLRIIEDDNAEKLGEDGTLPPEEETGAELDSEDSDDMFLKRLEMELLSQMNLGGIPAIRKVFMRHARVRRVRDDGTSDEKDMEWVLDTEGVNLLAVMAHEAVDFARTTSNDIVEVFEVLGIEAVRYALMYEVSRVISFDGSYVNYRHLAILVDTMTYRGHLMAITRHGINRVETGPLMKCSFEETTDILLEAATWGETDNLRGVTENIMLGQMAPVGTGSFKLYLNEKMLKEAKQPQDAVEVHEGAQTPNRAPGMGPLALSPGRVDAERMNANARATPGQMYSPAAWATPNRMATGRPGSPMVQSQFSPAVEGAQFSPVAATPGPGTARGAGMSGFTPMQSPGREYNVPMSPGPASPFNPQSPGRATSPAYTAMSPGVGGGGGGYAGGGSGMQFAPASPGYRLTSPGPAFGGGQAAGAPSPGVQYSPTSPGFSPTSPAYSPSTGGGAVAGSYSPSSPGYNLGAAASPAPGVGAFAGGDGAGASGGNMQYSPSSPGAYSPSSPGAFSPSSPAGNGYSPSTPAYGRGQSPAVNQYGYQQGQGNYSPQQGTGGQTSPTSPQYSPSSPQYSPR